MSYTTNSNAINNIIKSIAHKHGISAAEGYNILRHEFKMTKELIENIKDEDVVDKYGVSLIALCTIEVKPSYVKRISSKEENNG